ncbi:MAG: hypothetical protein KDD42_04205, partial [Bdellovibrionales bacterium]|nr:hypothetical protein [Bdellovibrionales bacterium]
MIERLLKENSGLVSICLIFFAVLWLYLPVHNFDFLNFDDNLYVTANQQVLNGITWEGIRWAFTSEHSSHWQPLAFISHMLDVELFGLDAGAHHLVSVVIHAVNCSLLFVLSYYSTKWLIGSLYVALLFGIHPMRIESVAWVSERKDVLSIFFLLLMLILYMHYSKKGSKISYLTACLALLLSLLSKPTAIVAPFLLLLLDFWPLDRFAVNESCQIRKRFLEKVPFFLLSVLSLLTALWAQGSGGGLKSLQAYPIGLRIDSVLVGYQTYFAKLFLPSEYAIFYPFEIYQPGIAEGALILLALLVSAGFWKRKIYPGLFFGILWYIVALLPMIGILQIGGQSYADRWSYLAHAGLIWGVTISLKSCEQRRLLAVAGLLYLLLFAAITRSELYNWRSSQAIFSHTLRVSPENFMAHNNLGVEFDRVGNLAEAKKNFDAAVRLAPSYPTALINLATVFIRERNWNEAEMLLKRAVAIS